MAEQIESAVGKGRFGMKVDKDGRAWTRSVSQTFQESANEKGDAYNINTGIVTLPSDAEYPLLYFKYTGDYHLHISTIILGVSTTPSAGSPYIMTVVRNPTAGTITTGTNVDISSNRNHSSPKVLNSTAKKWTTGVTMTDGSDHLLIYANSIRTVIPIDEHLESGASLGIKLDLNGTAGTDVYAAIVCHEEEDL